MVKKKSKVILISIITMLILSAVSMFVYGCFCLNKKKDENGNQNSQVHAATIDTCTDCKTCAQSGAGTTMKWSSSDWAWAGNDDYGLPSGLPVPAVFMNTYTLSVALANGETVTGGSVRTYNNSSDTTTGGITKHPDCKLTFRVFNDYSININNNRSEEYSNTNLGGSVFRAFPDIGYKFSYWEQSGNNIIAHFERVSHEVYWCSNTIHDHSSGCTWVSATGEKGENKIYGNKSFSLNIGNDDDTEKGYFKYNSVAGVDVESAKYSLTDKYVVGWQYAKRKVDTSTALTFSGSYTGTLLVSQGKGSSYILNDAESKVEHEIYLKPIWAIRTYNVIVEVAENNSDCECTSCKGGYISTKSTPESVSGVSVTFNLSSVSTSTKTITLIGVPYGTEIIYSGNSVEFKFNGKKIATVAVAASIGHYSSASFDITDGSSPIKGATTVTATFTPIPYHVNCYYSTDPAIAITTTNCRTSKNFYICGTNQDLPSVGVANKTVYETELFTSTRWKIGPFDGNSGIVNLRFNAFDAEGNKRTSGFTDTGYTMNYDLLSGSGINIYFNLTEAYKYLDLYGSDTTYDGYYLIVDGVNTGSYGDLSTVKGNGNVDYPVITNYWERNDNYLLYYNDVTEATFHTAGDSGKNGYNVEVEVSESDNYIDNISPTEVVKVDGNGTISVNNDYGTFTIGGTTITYSQEGYKVVGFRYKLIDLKTTADQVNTVSADNGWYYVADPGDWKDIVVQELRGTLKGVRGDNTLDSTSMVYAICVQPVMELVTYTQEFTIKCSEDSSVHGGYLNPQYNTSSQYYINEQKRTTLGYNEEQQVNYAGETIANGKPVKLVLTGLIYNMTFENNNDNIKLSYPAYSGVNFGYMGAVCDTIAGVRLYDRAGWENETKFTACFSPVGFTSNAYYEEHGGVPDDSNYKSASYFYCKDDDTNIESLDNIVDDSGETIKYFDGWQIGPFNSNDEYKNNTSYTCSVSGSVLTFSGPGLRVRFNLREIDDQINGGKTTYITDINGNKYYLLALDNEIKGYINAANGGNYGNLRTINSKTVITARWAHVYDLQVRNDGDGSLWKTVEGQAKNTNNTYLGATGGTGVEKKNGYTLGLKVDNRAGRENNYPFITYQGFAFYQKDDFNNAGSTTNTNNIISKLDANNWFAVYNYGYRLMGWEIYFTNTNGTKYYVKPNGANWEYRTDSAGSMNTVSDLDGKTIGGYAGMLDILYTAGLNEDIYLTITPVWAAAKINVYEVAKESNSNTKTSVNEIKRNSSAITFNSNYEGLTSGNVFVGTDFAIYKTAIGGKSITHDPLDTNSTWNYNNIEYNEFSYDESTARYRLNVISYSVSNIYKVTLDGILVDNNFEMLIENSDYKQIKDTAYANYDYYNNAYGRTYLQNGDVVDNYDTSRASKYKYTTSSVWQNDYADGLMGKITQYVADISNGSHELLRKVYTSEIDNSTKQLVSGNTALSSDPYIYLAHGYNTGTLPAFDHENYELIFWEDNVQGTNIYLTGLYDPDNEPGHRDDATGRTIMDPEKWSYLGDSKKNTTFDAHYFRKYYFINPEVKENGVVDQVGYLIIDSADQLEADPINRYEGTYLAIALKENETDANYAMHYYLIKGYNKSKRFVDYTDGFSLSKITIDGTVVKYNGIALEECGKEGIKIYSGCSVNISVFDQSQDPLGMASGKFDTMIGHKFNNIVSAKEDKSKESYNGYTLNGYDCDIVYVVNEDDDTDPMGTALDYINGESISIAFDFVKLQYNLEFKIDDIAAGDITVSYPGRTDVNVNYLKVDGLKVGDTVRIVYNASLGYDLQDSALAYLVKGIISGQDYEFTLFARNDEGAIVQEFEFTITGTWLRENYYCKYDSTGNKEFALTDKIDGDDDATIDLGTMIVNTEMIEFDYTIKLIDSQGNSVGEINAGKWNVLNKYLNIGAAVTTNDNNQYVVKYNETEYALIESYFSTYTGRKNLFYYSYDFPLNVSPIVALDVATNLKNIYNYGTVIVPVGSRTISSYIVVEPIYTINLNVSEATKNNDASLTVSLKLYNIAKSIENSAVFYLNQGEGTNTISILTYKGLNNYIIVDDYDEIVYSGATYNNDASRTKYAIEEVYQFAIANNANIEFTLVPADHQPMIKYFVNGTEVDSRPNDLLKDPNLYDLEINGSSMIQYARIGDVITPNYQSNSNKYVLSIKMGGYEYFAGANGKVAPITVDRKHLNNSYRFDFEVHLTEIANDDIIIELQLKDSAQERRGDEFGTFTINVDGTQVLASTLGQTSARVKAYGGKSVSLELNLNDGYIYSGAFRINEGNDISTAIVGNTLTLTESYDVAAGSRTYHILLEKVEYNIEWRNSSRNNYVYKVIDSTTQTKAIVGDIIELKQLNNSLLEERFENYYCEIEETKYEISNNSSTSFRVSADKIDGNKLVIGVTTREYRKVMIEMDEISQSYLERFAATAEELNVPLNEEVWAEIGTIDVSLSSKVETKYEYYYKINDGAEIAISEVDGVAEIEDGIAFNEDIKISLTIRPVEYDVYLVENHRGETIYNGSISSVDYENIVSDPTALNNNYGSQASIELLYKNDDFVMTTLKIEGNDSDEIVEININKDKIAYTDSDETVTGEKLVICGYEITISKRDNKITIKYQVSNEIKLTVEFNSLIEIKPAN